MNQSAPEVENQTGPEKQTMIAQELTEALVKRIQPSTIKLWKYHRKEVIKAVEKAFIAAQGRLTGPKTDDLAVAEAITYMREHYAERPSDEKIAWAVGITRPLRLQRAFRRVQNMSIENCLLQIQLTEAEKLIRKGAELGSLHRAVGIANPARFAVEFERMLKITLKEYAETRRPVVDDAAPKQALCLT